MTASMSPCPTQPPGPGAWWGRRYFLPAGMPSVSVMIDCNSSSGAELKRAELGAWADGNHACQACPCHEQQQQSQSLTITIAARGELVIDHPLLQTRRSLPEPPRMWAQIVGVSYHQLSRTRPNAAGRDGVGGGAWHKGGRRIPVVHLDPFPGSPAPPSGTPRH